MGFFRNEKCFNIWKGAIIWKKYFIVQKNFTFLRYHYRQEIFRYREILFEKNFMKETPDDNRAKFSENKQVKNWTETSNLQPGNLSKTSGDTVCDSSQNFNCFFLLSQPDP